jgi:protein-S-isoprenylcysteine O-methyltransferase Ste14
MTVNADDTPRRHMAMAVLLTLLLLVLQGFLPRGGIQPLRLLALPLLLVGVALAFLPFHALRRHGRTEPGRSYMHTTRVVDRGVYALVRHPQYLGYMLFDAGFALISQNVWIATLALLAVAFFALQVREEERFLRARFGPDYEDYARRVPGLNLPLGVVRRLRRRNPA